MKVILPTAILSFVLLWNSGCATVVTGKHQKVPVSSIPSEAEVKADNGVTITTPGSFKLLRDEDHVMVAEYPGCEPQQIELKHKLQGWFWGNILAGGVIGGIVDISSGASDKLVPENVHFDFTELGQAVAKRKQSYLRACPETKEKNRFAIQNSLSTKGMNKNELIASYGMPEKIYKEKKYEVFVYNNHEPKSYYFKKGILKKTKK